MNKEPLAKPDESLTQCADNDPERDCRCGGIKGTSSCMFLMEGKVSSVAKPDESGREKAEYFFRNDPRFRGQGMPPYTDGEMISIKERQGLINGVDVFEFAHLHAESIKREALRETVEAIKKSARAVYDSDEEKKAVDLKGATPEIAYKNGWLAGVDAVYRSAFEKGE